METCYTCFFRKWLVKNGPSAEIQSNGDLFWDNGVAWRRGGSGAVVRQSTCCQKWVCRVTTVFMTAVIMFGVLRNMAAAKDSGGGGDYDCAQTGCRGSSSSKTSGGGGGGGCFVAGSLVLTETNEAFPIEDISLGDVVAGGGRVTAILQFDGSTEDL